MNVLAMATQAQAQTHIFKKPGPPVPPRPQAASLLKNQRDAAAANTCAKVAANGLEQHPVLQRKPVAATAVTAAAAGGRTVVYKSPSLNLQKKQEEREKRLSYAENNNSSNMLQVNGTATATTLPTSTTSNHKPPLKLRKAPDVPNAKPRNVNKVEVGTNTGRECNSNISQRIATSTTTNNAGSSVVIVQAVNTNINLNRHNSLSSPKTTPTLKIAPRHSLGRVESEKVNRIQIEQLPASQPLPKPRKIVQLPVATLDLDETSNSVNNNSNVGVSLFRRSKTTMESFTSRVSNNANGKTSEIKNNIKNVAERLFSEILISNQQKQGNNETATPIITKHERAVQHQTLLQQELLTQQQNRQFNLCNDNVTVHQSNNTTRININASSTEASTVKSSGFVNQKAAFHELLIAELAAMRSQSVSMENLSVVQNNKTAAKIANNTSTTGTTTATTNITRAASTANTPIKQISTLKQRQRCNSLDDHDPDNEDVDADNIEDDAEELNEHDLNKMPKTNNANKSSNNNNSNTNNSNHATRKRCPSGNSSDSSPYGTERSARIRTSDWIEVGDNGKQVTLTSCHISLEDSGLEDEERLDDSSGVGDSWDSVKEAENEKRCRNVKRVMSITGLPPLPKSLSGINKMLGSDSGVISDADPVAEHVNLHNNKNKYESQKENTNNTNIINNNNFNSSELNNSNNNSNINNETSNNSVFNKIKSEHDNTVLVGSNDNDNMMAATSTAAAILATTNETATLATTANSPVCTLDAQIATLKKEMYSLRQLDLSLLSQLWALNDSIQEFRTILQDQDDEEDDESSTPNSATPSSYDSASSDEDETNRRAKSEETGSGSSSGNNTSSALTQLSNAKIITTQPKLQKSKSVDDESNVNMPNECKTNGTASAPNIGATNSKQKPAMPKPLDMKPVPRMRSAPPPPPTNRKAAAPPRPT